jgi:hypothetical protein
MKRQRRYPIDEIARRGEELYESKLRAILQPGNDGRILAIDIETGDTGIRPAPMDRDTGRRGVEADRGNAA